MGGYRTQRIAWYPYFDDCDAIIFLAPINCFDERLAEDRRINRLEDSYMLWKAVVSSKLLAKTSIVLFLNKCDLLEQKLLAGVRVKDYVHSYGDRPNDVEHATKCTPFATAREKACANVRWQTSHNISATSYGRIRLSPGHSGCI